MKFKSKMMPILVFLIGISFISTSIGATSALSLSSTANLLLQPDTLSSVLPCNISIASQVTNTMCGANNGAATAMPINGITPYSYLWSTSQTTASINNLAAGTYTVTVTDAQACTATTTVLIAATPIPTVTLTPLATTCGQTNGSVNISISGVTPFAILWNNGTSGSGLSNVAAGTYTVTVTDGNGCSTTRSATVAASSTITLTGTVANATCSQNNGLVDITVTNGTMPYTYLWTNSTTTQDLTAGAGSYTVTVTDAANCRKILPATISNAPAPTVTLYPTSTTCGQNNGGIGVGISGITPFTYWWSTAATTSSISNLSAGNYTVTITDANGCTKTAATSISASSAPTLSATVINSSCGQPNGSIDLTANGGLSPYTYLWSNAATTQDIAALVVGTYSCTVTDAAGCKAVGSASITTPPQSQITLSPTNATCNLLNGGIGMNLSGIQPFTFLWSNAATTAALSNVGAGTYTVTVTDGNLCQKTASATLTTTPAATASITAPAYICAGGTATLTASGGISYQWGSGANNATTASVTVNTGGTYYVTVTNSSNCSSVKSVQITQNSAINIAGTVTNATCGQANGLINLSLSGGTSPYSYTWTTGATTEDLITGAGTYSVTVADSRGCTAAANATVANTSVPNITLTPTNSTCGAANGGSAISVSGVSPFTYLWSNATTTNVLNNVMAGTYTITVTDANGCSSTKSTVIANSGTPTISVTSSNNLSCAMPSATLTATSSTNATFWWSNGATTATQTITTAATYTVTVTNTANNCTTTTTIIVTNATPAPTNLASSAITTTTALLSWTAVAGATSYQIEYKPNAATTWITVSPNITTNSYTLNNLTANTLYNFSVKAICNLGVSPVSVIQNFTTLSSTSTTYCTAQGSTTNNNCYITNVAMGAYTKTSGNNNGYANYTNTIWNVSKGVQYGISITPNYIRNSPSITYSIWIDFNQDNDFTDAGEMIYRKAISSRTPQLANLFIPQNAATGNVRMRVIMQETSTFPTPCGSIAVGEVEDFTLNIGAANLRETPLTPLTTLSIYPNPTQNKLTIQTTNEDALSSVRVFDMTGKLISQTLNIQNNQIQIDLENTAAGIYSCQVETLSGKITTHKIVKTNFSD